MELQIQHAASEESSPPETAVTPKKRFQIEKIEERIAPVDPHKKGGCTAVVWASRTVTVPGPY
jgi:hypothetical protein